MDREVRGVNAGPARPAGPADEKNVRSKDAAWVKRAVLTALQIFVTLAVLFFVFRDPAKRAEMARALGSADRRWLLAGTLVFGAVELIAVVRWQWLLRVQAIYLSWKRLTVLAFIGIFFNFFVPGGTGGDVVKIFYLLKETPAKRGPAVLSVLVDRILGLLGLIALAAFFIVARWDWLVSTPATAQAVGTALLIVGGACGAVLFSFVISGLGLMHRLPAGLPGRDTFCEIALAYNLYARAWKPTLGAFLISVAGNLGYFATFYCAAQAFRSVGGNLPTYTDLCAVMPVINTLVSLPISIGGLGLREGLFQMFLVPLCGVSDALAVVISSTGYFLTLAWGLAGGVLYAFYRPSEHARLREIEAEVATVEHSLALEELALEARARKPEP